MDVPTIAVYMNEYNTEVKENLLRIQRREEFQKAQTIESYTSTLSHEMRTPLLTVLFFLQYISNYLEMKTLSASTRA